MNNQNQIKEKLKKLEVGKSLRTSDDDNSSNGYLNDEEFYIKINKSECEKLSEKPEISQGENVKKCMLCDGPLKMTDYNDTGRYQHYIYFCTVCEFQVKYSYYDYFNG